MEIDIKSHWNNKKTTEVWLAKPDFKNEIILSYIFDNIDNLIDNGGVEIAVYCRKEKATLRITDHKILRFYAENVNIMNSFETKLKNIGFEKLNKKRNISDKFHHFHYSTLQSLSPSALKEKLKSDGFKKVSEQNEKNG